MKMNYKMVYKNRFHFKPAKSFSQFLTEKLDELNSIRQRTDAFILASLSEANIKVLLVLLANFSGLLVIFEKHFGIASVSRLSSSSLFAKH